MTANSGPVTTAGIIAVGNLKARIDGQVSRAAGGRLTLDERAELVDLIALRGHVLGCVADAERAAALADELVVQMPSDARSFLTRARMRGAFHRFESALTDLDAAEALGGNRVDVDAERAAIYQALGRYDEALAVRRMAVDRSCRLQAHWRRSQRSTAIAARWTRRSAGSGRRHVATAAPHPSHWRWWSSAAANCGWSTTTSAGPAPGARRRSADFRPTSQRRATSPKLTLPWGRRRRPSPAFGRWRWHPTIPTTRRGSPASCAKPAKPTRRRPGMAKAEARYADLLARHQDAFADHAAEFWLTIGGDPERALRLARHNLLLRQTPRARALVRRSSGHPSS